MHSAQFGEEVFAHGLNAHADAIDAELPVGAHFFEIDGGGVGFHCPFGPGGDFGVFPERFERAFHGIRRGHARCAAAEKNGVELGGEEVRAMGGLLAERGLKGGRRRSPESVRDRSSRNRSNGISFRRTESGRRGISRGRS